MNRRLFAAAALLPLVASCSAQTRLSIDRETFLAKLELAQESVATLEAENPFGALSFRSRVVDEEGKSSILLFGYDEEENAFYFDSVAREEHIFYYGGPVEGEEGEEPSYHYVTLDENDEYVEVEDEARIALIDSFFAEIKNVALSANTIAVTRASAAFAALELSEAEVKAQYEGEEEPEVAVGDLYLDLRGELYYQDVNVYGAGVSYAFGTIAEIEEGEDEEVFVLDEEAQNYEEGRYAIAIDQYEGNYYAIDYVEGDDTHLTWEFEFTFADPTIEEGE